MAEDLHNPLNNPNAEPVSSAPAPARPDPVPEPVDEELSAFLDDYFGEEEGAADTAPAEPAASQQEAAFAPDAPSAGDPAPGDRSPAPGADPASGAESASPPDDLQRAVLERLNQQLERMAQPAPEPAPQAPPVTPEMLVQHYQPRVQQYVDAGWMDEDYAALYPKQAALTVHMWDTGTQLQQGVQQSQAYTQEEQRRRSREQAESQLDSAISEVASRGDLFAPLGEDEVKSGFKEFLINEVNPALSQVTPDYLARQFYAYKQEQIFETIKEQMGQQAAAAPSGVSDADLAAQEGGSSRVPPAQTNLPEFVDLLEGTAAADWY